MGFEKYYTEIKTVFLEWTFHHVLEKLYEEAEKLYVERL
jgi:hypothetical protein